MVASTVALLSRSPVRAFTASASLALEAHRLLAVEAPEVLRAGRLLEARQGLGDAVDRRLVAAMGFPEKDEVVALDPLVGGVGLRHGSAVLVRCHSSGRGRGCQLGVRGPP